jgi:hypothetical protein
MFQVMKKRCNECLYGANRVVRTNRASEIIRELNEKDDYFICHKATLAGNQLYPSVPPRKR